MKPGSSDVDYSSLPWGKTEAVLHKGVSQYLCKIRYHNASPSYTSWKGLTCHLSVTLRSWELKGRASHHPVSVSRDILNICKGYEIIRNRENKGWLSTDLLKGCVVPLPPRGRRRLLSTLHALNHACCVLAYKQSQLGFIFSPSAVKSKRKICLLRSSQIKLLFLVKIGGTNSSGQHKDSVTFIDRDGLNYIVMHFIYWHVKDMAHSPSQQMPLIQ